MDFVLVLSETVLVIVIGKQLFNEMGFGSLRNF
jgi:hypothetical protein